MLSTVIGVLIVVADIWAILNIVQSGSTTGKKLLWIILILFFPIFGFIAWYFGGPKR